MMICDITLDVSVCDITLDVSVMTNDCSVCILNFHTMRVD